MCYAGDGLRHGFVGDSYLLVTGLVLNGVPGQSGSGFGDRKLLDFLYLEAIVFNDGIGEETTAHGVYRGTGIFLRFGFQICLDIFAHAHSLYGIVAQVMEAVTYSEAGRICSRRVLV